MASSENKDTIGSSEIVDFSEMENGFKKDKTRGKSNFTRALNKLMGLIDERDLTSRPEVIEARKRLESYWEILLDILTNFSDFYTSHKEHKKCERIVSEMERLETDFDAALKSSRDFLRWLNVDTASVSSTEMLTINLRPGLNIAEQSSETHEKEQIQTESPQETSKEQISEHLTQNYGPVPITNTVCNPTRQRGYY